MRRANCEFTLAARERTAKSFSAARKRGRARRIAAWTIGICVVANSVFAETRTLSVGPPALGLIFEANGLPEQGSKLSDAYAEANGWQALVREIVAGKSEAGGEFLGLGEIFFEINAKSAGPFDGMRLYIERLAAGEGASGTALSNFAATGLMIGARPNSQFAGRVGDPDAETVILSADRVNVFDAAAGNSATEPGTLAEVSFEVINLNFEAELDGALCDSLPHPPGDAISADLSARVQFQRTGLLIDSDLMLRREGKPNIALGAELDIRANAAASKESDAANGGGTASGGNSLAQTQSFLEQDGVRNGEALPANSPLADSRCPGDMLAAALSAADEILAAGTEISFGVKAKRSPSYPLQTEKFDESPAYAPDAGAVGVRADAKPPIGDELEMTVADMTSDTSGVGM